MSVQEFEVRLKPGQEWHSKALPLKAGEIVTLTCLSPNRFYAGFFNRERYVKLKGNALGAFDFPPGTDHPGYTDKREIEKGDDYYIVLRVSVFGDEQDIQVRFVREQFIKE